MVCIILCLIATGCTEHNVNGNLFSICYDYKSPLNSIALIVPGMNQSCSLSGYVSIAGYYKSREITPVYVNIKWKAVGLGKLSETAYQIGTMLKDSFPDSYKYLFGFSFGAAIVLKLSQYTDAKQVLLCSMSAVFEEDRQLQVFPFSQFMNIMTDYSSNGLSYCASQKQCIIFLYGDHENFLINKKIIAHRTEFFKCNKTIFVKNAGHKISGRTYLAAIKDLVRKN